MGGSLGTSKQASGTSQSSITEPWSPTQGPLINIVDSLKGMTGNYGPSADQKSALDQLMLNAKNMPNFGDAALGLSSSLLSGGADNTGTVNNAYADYQRRLSPYADGQNLDPTKAPGMAALLDTIKNDISGSVNGMFAGAGRDMSGMNQQTLARGMSQGMAAPLMDQYNKNVQNQLGSAGALFGAGGNTANQLQQLQQTMFGNQQQGLNMGMNAVPQAYNGNANQMLSAGSQAYNLPLQQLGSVLGMLLPIAGLGSQNSGSSTSWGTSTASPLQQMMGIGSMFSGGSNSAANGVLSMFSDRRLKEDIQQVGAMFDGTPIYRYRYLGDPAMRIGLMADEVEGYAPEAVETVHGFKAVNYEIATARAVGGA